MPGSVFCDDVETDSNNNKVVEKVLKKARSRIRTLFYWQTFGLVLSMSALLSVQMLQTSINIKDRVGSISVTVGFVTSLFVCLFICPTLLCSLGPTASLLVSEGCFLIYCVCNFYPELYVLVSGAIFSGIGRALFVPSYSMLIITLTSHCAKYTTRRRESHYFNQFQSKFYSLNEFVQIVGNGLSYAILYSTYQPHTESSNGFYSNGTNSSLFQYCGANDCQDASVVSRSIYQYVPPTKISVYLFLSSTVLLLLIGIFVHCVIYPGIAGFSHKLENIEDKVRRDISVKGNKDSRDDIFPLPSTKSDGLSSKIHEEESTKLAINGHFKVVSSDFYEEKDKCAVVSAHEEDEYMEKRQSPKKKDKERLKYCITLRSTLLLMVQPRSLLLSISTLHHGMMIGFAFADLTRAYASCVAGVQVTGAFAATFGVAGIISAYVYGKALPYLGRHIIYYFSTGLELAVYVLCYLWVPDPNTIGVVFIIFIGVGIVNGVFRQNMIAAYTMHFPESKSIALTAFNIAFTGGMGIQYGLSTFMCVRDKVYAQFAITVAGLFSFVLAEWLLMGRRPGNQFEEVKISFAT